MLSTKRLLEIININKKIKLTCKVDKLGASSIRNTFFVKIKDRGYKLRKCLSVQDAKHLEKRIKEVSGLSIFPKYLGRHREWLCFEYLKLSEARRDESGKFWFNLGESIGKLESLKTNKLDVNFAQEYRSISARESPKFLCNALEILYFKKFLNNIELIMAKKHIKRFFKNKVRFCFNYLDLLPGNILNDTNKIWLVDEEGISRGVAGLSLIRPLDIWKSQTPEIGISREERKNFFKGYIHGGGDLQYFEKYKDVLGIIYYTLKSYDSLLLSGTTTCSIRRLKHILLKLKKEKGGVK